MIVKDENGRPGQIQHELRELEFLCRSGSKEQIIARMKQMVPEYNNIRYRKEKEGLIDMNKPDS